MSNTALAKKGLIFVGSATASAASSVSFTDLDTNHYVYDGFYLNVDKSTDAYLLLRTSTNNGSTYDSGASDYYSGYHYAFPTTSITGAHVNANSEIRLETIVSGGASTGENSSGDIRIYSPGDSTYCYVVVNGGSSRSAGDIFASYAGGVRLTTTAINAFEILPSTGTFSGTFHLYATRKS